MPGHSKSTTSNMSLKVHGKNYPQPLESHEKTVENQNKKHTSQGFKFWWSPLGDQNSFFGF